MVERRRNKPYGEICQSGLQDWKPVFEGQGFRREAQFNILEPYIRLFPDRGMDGDGQGIGIGLRI